MFQDNVYLQKESDDFFRRCRNDVISELSSAPIRASKRTIYQQLIESDIVLDNSSVLEVGCFVADLLALLASNHNCSVEGIEPSSLAVEFANERFGLDISNNTLIGHYADQTLGAIQPSFDLIIVEDVISWMPRQNVLLSLSILDQLLKPGGHLFIRDFCPSMSFAYRNHHIKSHDVFNYKTYLGHKQFFLLTGQYSIAQEYVRSETSLQNISTSRPDSCIWSDCLLTKHNNPLHPTLDFNS